MKIARKTIGIAAFLALALTTGDGAGLTRQPVFAAEQAAGGQTSIPAQAAAPGVSRDAEAYAKDFGVPLPEAIRRLEAQSAAGPFVDRLEIAAGTRFSALWLEHEPEFRLVVSITGAGIASLGELTNVAATAPIPVVVREGATLNRSRAETARLALERETKGRLTVTGLDFDVRENSMIVETTDVPPSSLADELTATLGVKTRVVHVDDFGDDVMR